MLTEDFVGRFKSDGSFRCWSMVGDSFGTHCSPVEVDNTLRQQFERLSLRHAVDE